MGPKCNVLTISPSQPCGQGTILQNGQCVPDLLVLCSGGSMIENGVCVCKMVGGMLFDIDAVAVLSAAIGTDPLITGLVALTMAGVVGQAAWLIHRRKRKIKIE